MGFPVGYSELMLPRFLLHLIFLLGFIRRLLTWVFTTLGLGDLLDSPDIPESASAHLHLSSSSSSSSHHHRHRAGLRYSRSPLASAALIQEALPVTTYGDLVGDQLESCAVCLYEFEGTEEVRRLSNCRHIFHRCCIDPWVELDQRTCPLCRTPLIPDHLRESFDRKLSAGDSSSGPSSNPASADYGDYSSYGYGDYSDDADYHYLPLEDDYPSSSLDLVGDYSGDLIWPSASSAPLFS